MPLGKEIYMAQFTNQARLSYLDNVTVSNVAVGQLLNAITVTKTPVSDTYSLNDSITYVINIINTGTAPYSNLTVTDDLGAYEYNGSTLVPLDYVDGSIKYFINGVLQPAPTVTSASPLTVSGISVPVGGNTAIVYEATTNQFAPLNEGGQIVNQATVSGSGFTPITADSTVTVESAPQLSISKSISPIPVSTGGTVTYTFTISNTGNTPLLATDNAILTDTFDPILSDLTVTFNGVALVEGVGYSYDQLTGLFSTLDGQITVPAASYTQGSGGEYLVTPGESVLVITGTI